MKVSVILTTYKNPVALRKVMESLSYQLRMPDELIVADDGSGERTREVIENFRTNLKFQVKHVWQEDQGFRLARIRNSAIRASVGQYLIILDGDCIPNRHFVADHLRLAEQGFFVQGKRVLLGRSVSERFDVLHANTAPALLRMAFTGLLSNSHHILRLPAFPSIRDVKLRGIKSCNMGLYREDVMAVNGFNEKFEGWGREDTEFGTRLYRYGLRRKQHPFMAICFHLWHEESPRDKLEANERILKETIQGSYSWCEKGITKDRETKDRGKEAGARQ